MVLQLIRDWGTMYLLDLPAHVRSGDLIAILIALLLLYGCTALLSKVTPLILEIVKKLVILAIIVISAHIFLLDFFRRILAAGCTPTVAIVGALGLLIAIIAVSIALYRAAMAIVAQRKQDRPATETPPGPPGEDTAETSTVRRGETADTLHATGAGMAQASSLVSAAYRLHYLTRETSLGRVILYLVIAEFGIFSSKTIAAASAGAGLSFFLIFLLAALVFIKIRYADYRTGIRHLTIVCILGFLLSLILGHFWGDIPVETLLSVNYFRSEALVALITGISLSLFMANKD